MTLQIYFDYNACAPLKNSAYDKMIEVLKKSGNASSIHSYGRHLSSLVEEARFNISHSFGCKPKNIIFQSCGTEANNFVIQGFEQQGFRILVSATDHLSILQASRNPIILPVNRHGLVNIEVLENLLTKNCPTLVSIQWANNESGILQDITSLCTLIKSYGAYFHSDAIQLAGRAPLHFEEINLDALTIASSKLGGPSGAAALILKDGITFPSLLKGGGQEKNRRAGTLNASAIAGFGQAVQNLSFDEWRAVQTLRDFLEKSLKDFCKDIEIYGDEVTRLPNTSLIRMPGVLNDLQLMTFDLAGCAVSAGSACSSGKIGISHVLSAMNVPSSKAREVIRISLGPSSTQFEVEHFINLWTSLYTQQSLKAS